MKDKLTWNEESRKTVYTCPIFSVSERYCRSPFDGLKTFNVIDTNNWAMVLPLLDDGKNRQFLMVRQWRHGACEMSLEFPGGVFNRGEDALTAAKRELLEETGYTAGKIEKLGEFNPNPAIMSNRIHFFIARDLELLQKQNLDEDEYVEVEKVSEKELIEGLGKPPFIHALIGTAISLYIKQR